ncbi:hypothetical protein Phum_PHUM506450 [Pediculus humanus corporis]|uniref:Uncharacterized protein n=1 Tax=Pediculus humanus subsp. corporis TaxID=121224 RepID=E0VXX5_PEDHC|nr:uncharacterized protein Phum_PHUM506450 [Pediculus humanus corporis]EEB18231.1 hypothetical protein Phum_PHUM506450 [Pediculus humanus corporis]
MCQESSDDEQTQQQSGNSQTSLTSSLPGELTISDGLLRALGTAGVLITGIAGIAAILSFLLPMFGFRSCMLFGTCDSSYDTTAYSNVNSNSIYDTQGYGNYQYNGNPYKKRSLEYVGPILKMLTAAYDKYGPKYSRQSKSFAFFDNQQQQQQQQQPSQQPSQQQK